MRTYETFANEHDMLFNAKESAILKLLNKNLKSANLHCFKLNGDVISEVSETKYLGQCICNDLSDNVERLYVQGNMIMWKFYTVLPRL